MPRQDHGGRSTEIAEVFRTFLKLGLISFGGPAAHIGYFREAFVVRRRWIGESEYADLVALCQFLPGPASSQLGFAIGIMRGRGLAGGIAAWVGFTLPSALFLAACGLGVSYQAGFSWDKLLHGLNLVAVAVVAQAVWGMARTVAPFPQRIAISFLAFALCLLWMGPAGQVLAITLGAVAGLLIKRPEIHPPAASASVPIGRRAGLIALGSAIALLVLLPLFANSNQALALFSAFYRSGALVFGGGHVVLPLLESSVVAPGWVNGGDFLAGYGLAQAVPGPLFTFAAYLGAVAAGPVGAMLALVAIFLPGLLMVFGVLPFWGTVRAFPPAQAAMGGANAAVVGILAAALYTPVWTSAIIRPVDLVLAVGGFLLLTVWRMPPWSIVALLGVTGAYFA